MKRLFLLLCALLVATSAAVALTDNEALNILAGTSRLTDNAALNLLAVNGPNLIKLRRDTAANWTSINPVLAQGEVGVELSASSALPHKIKIGDGVTAWTSLRYNYEFLGIPGAGSVIRFNADGTQEFLNSSELANFLGVTTDGALNAAMADPTSNGSWSAPTWRDKLSLTGLATPRLTKKLGQIIAGENVIASVAIWGDSYGIEAFDPANLISLWQAYGFRGTFILPGYQATLAFTQVYGTTATENEFNFSLNGSSWVLDASGEGIGFGCSAQPYSSHVNSNTIFYGKSSGAGTFKIQTAFFDTVLASTIWTDVTTIDCNDATTQVGSYTVALLPGQVARAIWASGAVRICGALVEDTTATRGVIASTINRGGLNLTSAWNTIPAASLTPQMTALAADLVTVTMDETDPTTSYPVMIGKWQTALPDVEFFLVGAHNSSTEGAARTRVDGILSVAKSYSFPAFDELTIIPSYAWAVARGLMQDTGHLNGYGYYLVRTAVWNAFWKNLGTSTTALAQNVVAQNLNARTITEDGYTSIQRKSAAAQRSMGLNGVRAISTIGQVQNITALSNVDAGPFAISVWLEMPATQISGRMCIFSTHTTTTFSDEAYTLVAYGNSDGTIHVRLFQANTSTYHDIVLPAAEVAPFLGSLVNFWVARDANNLVTCGFGSYVANESCFHTDNVKTAYVGPGYSNSANSGGMNPNFRAFAFWNGAASPSTWDGLGKPPGSPTLWWPLDERSGTVTADATGNGNYGVINSTYTAWSNPQGILTATATLNLSTGAKTVTVTGAAVGDWASACRNDGTASAAAVFANVTAADTVTVTAPATTDGSVSYRVRVWK